MLTDKSRTISKIPLIEHLLHWGAKHQPANDDGQGLLEDDPLSIPLEDRCHNLNNAHRRTESSSHEVHSSQGQNNHQFPHLKHRAHQIPRFFQPGTACLMAAIVALTLLFTLLWTRAESKGAIEGRLLSCGNQQYSVNNYTCYTGNFLCPVEGRQRMLKCGNDCYLPQKFQCSNGQIELRQGTMLSNEPGKANASGSCPLSYLHLTDLPYENYFVSDCSSASQVVVTNPQVDSGLRSVGPRLLIAWPSGNSGIVTYFLPGDGSDSTLGIFLENFPGANRTVSPLVGGVTGVISFNSSAVLDLAIIGSIRTIRDYVEGNSLNPTIQNALQVQRLADGAIQLSRTWLDNVTETFLVFQSNNDGLATINNGKVHFEKGVYLFSAWHNYPELEQLSPPETLNPQSQELIVKSPDETKSLAFFSFTSKVVAGGWRFLTYFGRDSLISLLLLWPVLSEGDGGVVEAILSAAIERINASDGSVCHEEVIGDYATYLNDQVIPSTDPQCDYKMVDTGFFLPIAMNEYFVKSQTGEGRRDLFLAQNASFLPPNRGLTFADLILVTLEKIMNITAPFEKSPTVANLVHLKDGQSVGQWRDSNTGLGGGRIPYDVNTALVPAALRAIASLTAGGLFPSHPEWSQTASKRALFWEENTLHFFEVEVSVDEAQDLVKTYIARSNFPGHVNITELTSPTRFYGLALEANDHPIVRVMNTDDCFRLYLLNSTNQAQLSAFLSQTAHNILRPFPIGLSTSVGLLVANPAYARGSVNINDFKTNSYHGLVVWSWQLSMMAAGLERQLDRCNDGDYRPDFCSNTALHSRIVQAYNHLWDIIEQNRDHLSSEVWSWIYRDGDYVYTPLGAIPGPDGQNPTESDIRQLWSLTFLVVKRNPAYSLK